MDGRWEIAHSTLVLRWWSHLSRNSEDESKQKTCLVKLAYFLQFALTAIKTRLFKRYSRKLTLPADNIRMTSHTFPHAHCWCSRLQGKRPAASSPPTRYWMTKLHRTHKWLLVNIFVVVRWTETKNEGPSSVVSLSILPMHGIDAYHERPASAVSGVKSEYRLRSLRCEPCMPFTGYLPDRLGGSYSILIYTIC